MTKAFVDNNLFCLKDLYLAKWFYFFLGHLDTCHLPLPCVQDVRRIAAQRALRIPAEVQLPRGSLW